MRTPKFWQSKNILSDLLCPLGVIYALLTKLRVAKPPRVIVSKPVICVGNITAGGTGKTPVAISLSKILKENFYNPYFISRGYGGKLRAAVVDLNNHSPKDVGDEPMLLAQYATTIINANRGFSAKQAIDMGADVVIMDDGFQNPVLEKDISFIVFDGGFGWGNKRCIPAGPLREKWYRAAKRANAVIIVGDDKFGLANKIKDKPIFYAQIKAIKPKIENKNILAFAGIGRPQKFYDSLKQEGFNIVFSKDFPDHHFYTKKDFDEMIKFAQLENLDIWTTSKDYVKIPAEFRPHFKVLEIEIKWQDELDISNFIINLLKKVDKKV